MTEAAADGLVEAIARLATASAAFAEAAEFWAPAMIDWVAAMEPVGELSGLEVRADASLTRLRCRLTGPAAVVGPSAAAWHEQLGVGGEDPWFADAAQRVGTGAGGSWIDLGGDDLLAGWDVDVAPDAGVDALALLPATKWVARLAASCRAHGVDVVHRIGVLAGGAGDCDATFALPGPSLDAQAGVAMAMLDDLAVGQFPEPVLGALLALGRPRLLAEVSLTSDGVVAVAVGSVDPSTPAVLALCDRVGVGDDTALAAFEAAIGVESRAVLQAVRADPDTVRLGYRLA